MIEDSFAIEDNLKEIKKYNAKKKFFPSIYRNYFKKNNKNNIFFLMNTGFYQKYSSNYNIPRFSTDCSEKIYCGQSVVYMLLQLAFYMGFKEIRLLGVDLEYKIPKDAKIKSNMIYSYNDDENHFYKTKNRRWKKPEINKFKRCLKFAEEIYKWNKRKIKRI